MNNFNEVQVLTDFDQRSSLIWGHVNTELD